MNNRTLFTLAVAYMLSSTLHAEEKPTRASVVNMTPDDRTTFANYLRTVRSERVRKVKWEGINEETKTPYWNLRLLPKQGSAAYKDDHDIDLKLPIRSDTEGLFRSIAAFMTQGGEQNRLFERTHVPPPQEDETFTVVVSKQPQREKSKPHGITLECTRNTKGVTCRAPELVLWRFVIG